MNKNKGLLIFRIVISVFAAVCFLGAVYFTCGIWFETNDDVFISEMLSGKLTGTPEYHCPYVSTFLTYPISKLYSLFPGIPWWGLLIAGFLGTMIFLNVFSITRRAKNLLQLLLFASLFLITVILGIHNFGQAQFTSAAMLLAVTGYVWLANFGVEYKYENEPASKGKYELKKNLSGIVGFFVCEFLACSLRDSAMMVVQPVGFCLVLGVLIFQLFKENENSESKEASDKKAFKKNAYKMQSNKLLLLVKPAVIYGVIVLACLGSTKLIQAATFSDPNWKTYQKYDTACVYLFDYEQPISYEEISDIIGKYDISKEDYEAFLSYRIWYQDYKFSVECIDELLPRLKEIRANERDVNLAAGVLQLLFTSTEFWHIHQITAGFFVLALILIIVLRVKKYLPALFTTMLGYLVGIIFLAYRNRYVLRVMFPYYYGTIMLLTVLVVLTLAEGYEAQVTLGVNGMASDTENAMTNGATIMGKRVRGGKKIVLLAVTTCLTLGGFLVLSLPSGRVQFSYIKRQNSVVNSINRGIMNDLTAYCNQNPDKHFILDCSYTRYSSTPIFDGDYYRESNYIYSGSWYATAPSMIARGQKYLGEDNPEGDSFYFLVYEAQEWRGADALPYYETMADTEAMLTEKFKISNGATIWVYKL